jgi:hypothetical protein
MSVCPSVSARCSAASLGRSARSYLSSSWRCRIDSSCRRCCGVCFDSLVRRRCAMWTGASGGRRSDILSAVSCAVSLLLFVVVDCCVRARWMSHAVGGGRVCGFLRRYVVLDGRNPSSTCASVLCQRPVPASSSIHHRSSSCSSPPPAILVRLCPRRLCSFLSDFFSYCASFPSRYGALLWFALFSYTSFSVTRPAGLGDIDTHTLPSVLRRTVIAVDVAASSS